MLQNVVKCCKMLQNVVKCCINIALNIAHTMYFSNLSDNKSKIMWGIIEKEQNIVKCCNILQNNIDKHKKGIIKRAKRAK